MIELLAFPKARPEKRACLLQAVEAIGPILAESANDSERLATLAPTAVEALQTSGLLKLGLPDVVGGAEADPALQLEVIEALAYIDTASAWCTMISTGGTALLGAFLPESALQRVFPEGRTPFIAVTIHPVGTAVPVDGGYRVSGHWRFCSGIRHADWVCGIARIQQPDGQTEEASSPETIMVTLPVSAVTILDNWHVVGLRGTGSCDISVTDCFVPCDLTFQRNRTDPAPRRGGPLYRLGNPGFLAQHHIGFALGLARRALAELIGSAQHTKSASRPAALQERQIIHRLVGKFDLTLKAARSLALDRYTTVMQKLVVGATIDRQCHVELVTLATYTTELAVEMATAAFRYGGGRALYQPNILERLLRDSQAAAQHALMSDQQYETHGNFLIT
jgi:alkylation response protein AidB-like acyl-CoA dehydrogenase